MAFKGLLNDMADYLREERRLQSVAVQADNIRRPQQQHKPVPLFPPKMEIGHLISDMAQEWSVFKGEFSHNKDLIVGVRYVGLIRTKKANAKRKYVLGHCETREPATFGKTLAILKKQAIAKKEAIPRSVAVP
ncbi:hypothetical protein BG000_000335, partial [Podila horticola]